jgi:ribosome recycling factor
MEKTLDSVRRNFGTVRTGRANVSILDRIQVDYYGTMTPLKKVANASTPDAQTITIQPFDKTCVVCSSVFACADESNRACLRLNVLPCAQCDQGH